jgi:hypothetical protein
MNTLRGWAGQINSGRPQVTMANSTGSAAMWNRLGKTAIVLMLLMLAGCNDENAFLGSDDDGTGTDSNAASITLLASSPQLGSSGGDTVTLTAIVKDDGNSLLSGAAVVFTTDSGSLTVTQNTTDDSGQAIATLGPGNDFTNRTITVTATTGSKTATVDVNVIGTSIAVSGESSATLGDTTALVIALTDSDNNPISGKVVTISSARGNTLSASSLTTNSSGQATVNVTATTAGTDTITVSAQGATATHDIAISGDQFQMSTPAANADIDLGDCETVQVSWSQNGTAVNGGTVNFSATRGTLYLTNTGGVCSNPTTTITTNSSGLATIYIKSSTAGPSTLTAYVTNGPSTGRTINFVATTPDAISVQAEPSTIGPNDGSQSEQQESTITAVVRDPNNNLVKGKVVRFSIIQDNSGGNLTAATAITDDLGRASTRYVSSAATTSQGGVQIQAVVDEDTTINNTVSLTVARSALFVRLGTGNLLDSPNETTYDKKYTAIVTDADGKAAAGTEVNITVNPLFYAKGSYIQGSPWVLDQDDVCASEDTLLGNPYDMNGVLDNGEDLNGDNDLTPGNVTSVPVDEVTTGADGTVQFSIIYPKEFANWVYVRLTATTTVQGTESHDEVEFWLPVLADDVKDEDTPPPGQVSPFGTGACP